MKDKTKILPKCLTELRGKTLLEWQIEAIHKSGIKEIAVFTGYHANEIIKRFPKLTYFHNKDWDCTNMVSTLFEADKWLSVDECLVSYADILYTNEAVLALAEEQAEISLTYYTKFMELWEDRFANPLDDIETFKIDASGILAEIGQKAKSLEEIKGQYMGILKFRPAGWARVKVEIEKGLPKPLAKMDMTGLFNCMIGRGLNIKGVPYEGGVRG
ncbi:MAG: phosphocholine cytidylyltransferase family protein [Selenomonas sp.]|nr:phosphocholine cytidylyltransferase family protein [Selenomonas sp.]